MPLTEEKMSLKKDSESEEILSGEEQEVAAKNSAAKKKRRKKKNKGKSRYNSRLKPLKSKIEFRKLCDLCFAFTILLVNTQF